MSARRDAENLSAPAPTRKEDDPLAPLVPEPSEAEFARAMNASFLQQFRHLLTALIVLLMWLLLTELVTLESGQPWFIWEQLALLGVLGGTRWAIAVKRLRSNVLHFLGALIVVMAMAHALHFVLTSPGPPSFTPLIFILVIAGSLFFSLRWYAAVLFGTIALWTAFTWGRMTDLQREEYVAMTFMFAFLSASLFLYRTRTQANLERLRLREEKQKHELHRALNVAHLELVERENSEAALRESEERYRHIIERSPMAIVVHDTERITLANRALAELVGLSSAEECLGLKIDDFIHPDSREFLAERARFIRDRHEPTPPADIRVVGVDGEIREVEVTAQPVTLGGRPMIQAVLQNVTERRAAERALRQSEERYRLLAENVTDGIWTADLDLRFTYLSPAAARIMKVPLEEALDVPLDRMLTPESLNVTHRVFGEELMRARAEGSAYAGSRRVELEMVRGDGTTIWIEVDATILLDAEGNPTAVQGVSRDISERKRAEAELRSSEERYRLLAENVTDGIWTSDLNLRFTYFSPSIEKIFGIPVDRALEIPIERMMTPESLRSARRALTEQLALARRTGPEEDGERTLELQFFRGDGTTVWTEVKSRILRDAEGNPSGVLGVTRDITERRRAEEELRLSEERFRLLAEHATDVIFTSDLRLNFTFLSPAASRLFGYDAAEIEQCPPELLLAPASLEIVKASLKEELDREADGQADPFRSRTFELEYRTRDGGTVWTEVRVSFLRDPDGSPTGLVGVIRDISERLQAQEEKRKLEAQLAQAQKLEAIGTLAGGIAHDFNNLLTGILGYADLLKLEAEEGDPVYESAEIIQTAATRARELTSQLLGFARKGKHRNIPVDINRTIEEVVNLLGRTFDKKIRIETDLGSGRAVVLGDPAQLQQIILNLAVNARDAMPEGGVLRIETGLGELRSDEAVRLGAEASGAYVTLTVSDTGPGIPAEIQDRVFEPFFTTKEPGQGTGMGLAMVYGIVKNHGGFIELKSEPGQGTEFRLRFPAVSSEEDIPQIEASRDLVRGCGRILIVDDEPVVRRMAGDMLKYLGYDVTTIGDSTEAVEYYRTHHDEIDLVLIDMIMPGLGGRECFRAMKEINPEVRAVLSTGYGQDAAAQRIIDEGVQGFIQKPYEVNRLSQAIARVLAA